MKKLFGIIFFAIALPMLFASCEEGEDSKDLCIKGTATTCPTLTFSSCSDGSNSYLIYNGKKYTCDGNNCANAQQQIISASGCAKGLVGEAKIEMENSLRNYMKSVQNRVFVEAIQAAGVE